MLTLEDVANDLLAEHATTILDPDRSRIVIIDFVDNPYHGSYLTHPREVSFDEASRRNHQLSPLLYRVRPRYEETAPHSR